MDLPASRRSSNYLFIIQGQSTPKRCCQKKFLKSSGVSVSVITASSSITKRLIATECWSNKVRPPTFPSRLERSGKKDLPHITGLPFFPLNDGIVIFSFSIIGQKMLFNNFVYVL